MTKEQVAAVFLLAKIPYSQTYRIENAYWRNTPELAKQFPWWLVRTPNGLIKIGWRKHVINIDWSDTGVEAEVTRDEVIKEKYLVHAWSYGKAVEYLTELGRQLARALATPEPTAATDGGAL